MRRNLLMKIGVGIIYGLILFLFHVFARNQIASTQWLLISTLLFFSIFFVLPLLAYTRYKYSHSMGRLNSILDSTAEAIYGIDHVGNCTFANQMCLSILGYNDISEIIGKNMHELIHHTQKDGSAYPKENCRILGTVSAGMDYYSKEEVFFRKDGSKFFVELRSRPQYLFGRMIGSVVSFSDISDKKVIEEQMTYLMFHDAVTGLYNQTFLHEEILRLDVMRNLPFSVIVGDMNHLKLTNDTFGHDAGDELIRLVGIAIQRACREDDIVARMGGDEFAILLPQTTKEDALAVLQRIEHEVEKIEFKSIKGSIALGIGTKVSTDKNMKEIFAEAEEAMYQYKHVHQRNERVHQLTHIMDAIGEKSLREKIHAQNVSELCEKIAIELKLSQAEVRRAKEAGYYHDIGKIGIQDELIQKIGQLEQVELIEMKRHAVIGFRILSLFDETIDLAKGALEHHEYFDGSGYPKGLKGSDISLMGRIIAVAEAYDYRTNPQALHRFNPDETLNEIRLKSNIQFDPHIVSALEKVISKK